MLETSALFKSLDQERLQLYADLRASPAAPKENQRALSHVVESIRHGPLLVPVSDASAADQSLASKAAGVKAIYLPASDKVLLARGSQLKLQSRSALGQGEFFEGAAPVYFGNRIRSVFDQVRLAITPRELKNLLELLAWSQCEGNLVVSSFLESIEASYSGQAIRAPYLEALLATKALTRVAVLQFKRIEDEARTIEALELTLKEVGPLPSSDVGALRRLNFIEVNELLSVLVSLEDQLYQIASKAELLPAEAKRIVEVSDMSRAHTALGRLSSLLSLPSDQQLCPASLADHGICNLQDKNLTGGLRFFQHLQVEMEDVFLACPDTGARDIQAALESQFRSNLMVRGFDSWNVPLYKSLNSMPPSTQRSGLRGTAPSAVTGLYALPHSDFVLTTSDDAAINVWSTRAGLTPIAALNFKLQCFMDPKDSISRAHPYFYNFKALDGENGVVIYTRRGSRAAAAEQEASNEATGATKEVGDTPEAALDSLDPAGLLQAVLSDDEASSVLGLVELQEEYEQAAESGSSETYEDIFAALEHGEELGKLSAEKKKDQKGGAEKKEKEKKEASKSSAEKKEEADEEEKPVEPNLDWLWQLKDMGFPEPLCSKALVKVKNESIAAAVEAVVALQEEEKGKKAESTEEVKKVTLVEWTCSACTMINKAGGTVCDMCCCKAPEQAFVDAAGEQAKREAEDSQKKEEEERLAREKKAEEEERQAEERKRIQEEK